MIDLFNENNKQDREWVFMAYAFRTGGLVFLMLCAAPPGVRAWG